jgi:hypothetical protein
MSDTSSGSRRSGAKSSAKPAAKPRTGAKPPAKKNAGRREVLATQGVLANLPRTRPQRSSARRDAARRTVSVTAAEPTGAHTRRQPRTAAAKAQAVPTAGGKPRPTPALKAQPVPTAGGKPRPTPASKAQPASTPGRKPRPTPTSKAQPASTPGRKQTAAKKRPAKAKAERFQDPAPRQGFETERDPVSGSVQPPGGVDLLSSAAELVGELTKSGLSSGGRLFKDVFSRLPLN